MDSKRIIGGIVTFAALALAGEWIVRAADMLLNLAYQNGAFDWAVIRAAIGLAVLPVGLYFLFRPASKSATLAAIERIIQGIDSVRYQIEHTQGPSRRGIYTELASLYLNLENLGISTPSLANIDLETAYQHGENFLLMIRPLLRDGHVQAVQQNAPLVIREIGATASPIRKRWGRAQLRHVDDQGSP
jgi:hypothetical protein